MVGACAPATSRPAAALAVARGDTVRTTVLARGVVHERRRDDAGPWTIHVVRVDLARCGCALEARHAFDGLRGRERTSAIAARRAAAGDSALAAINASFFDLRSGDIVDDEVIDGEWWRGHAAGRTPGPQGMAGPRVHVATLGDGRVVTGRMALRATVAVVAAATHDAAPSARVAAAARTASTGATGTATTDATLALDAINPQRRGTLAVALYTPRFGTHTPVSGAARDSGATTLDPDDGPPTPARLAAQARRDSLRLAADTVTRTVVEATLAPADGTTRVTGGVTRWTVTAVAARGAGGAPIPAGGAVLSVRADAPAAAAIAALAPGTPLVLDVRLVDADGGAVGAPRTLVAGFGALLARGRDVSARSDAREGTRPSFSAARHPRTALGTRAGGRVALLVTVDGRNAGGSVGMTLAELAALMRRLGATDAANLDGGGSTTMWLRGAGVVNAPSDPTGERAIADALLVVPRR